MIELRIISSDWQKKLAKDIVENHHSYVPTYKSVGRRIDWLIYDVTTPDVYPPDEECVGMIGIGSSTYPPCKDILKYFNLTKSEYKDNFNSFANNWRFCMTKSIPNAGTQVLKGIRKLAPSAWKEKYGDDLKVMITFVAGGNNGSVYLADNWVKIGETAGLPKHKAVSMKWDKDDLNNKFIKPTGENKKIIFVKSLKKGLDFL